MESVAKTIRCEIAHRLVNGYPGKCAHCHGHGLVVQITLTMRHQVNLDQFGFVTDYANFGPLKQWIDECWDHAILLHEDDPLVRVLQSSAFDVNGKPHRVHTFDGNPTSENIARRLLWKARQLLENDRVYVSQVKVFETCTSECTLTVSEL